MDFVHIAVLWDWKKLVETTPSVVHKGSLSLDSNVASMFRRDLQLLLQKTWKKQKKRSRKNQIIC